jgi:copper homeostasis protein
MSLLEVIALNREDAIRAEAYGADRLELVSAIGEGGLTPSYGTIKTVVSSVSIPVMVMVRPHSYSFTYTKEEWQTIREDIKAVQDLGAAGIVFGAITDKKTIDFDLLAMVLEEARGLSVTFHRAIDEANTWENYLALRQSPNYVDRVLTSGGKVNVPAGIETIRAMVKESRQNPSSPLIMPGAGLSLANIAAVHEQLHADEYHFGSAVRAEGQFPNPIEEEKIKRILEIVK